MSNSTRSRPESPSSPATGAATAPEAPFRSEDPKRAALDSVEIELEVSRQRTASWAIGGTIGGILLVLKLGTVGVWAGWVLIAIGLFRTAQLVQSFLYPPGTIRVSAREVVLPRGLHRTRPVKVAPAEVTAAYFLRRSVPFNRSAPVLIVELGDRAMTFPRDWFASEADQRHVVHALLSHRPAPAGSAELAKPAAAE